MSKALIAAKRVIGGLIDAGLYHQKMIKREGPKPLPRLKHIQPGETFTLKVPPRTYQLLRKDDDYGYVENGKIGLSAEIKPDGMEFKLNGWRKV